MTDTKGESELSVYDLLGLNDVTTPDTPEEKFYYHLTGGTAPRIDNMLHFLKHELEHYKHLVECGVILPKVVPKDYLKAMLKYYLQMHHLSRFVYVLHDDGGEELPKLDLDKTVALFLGHPGVQKIITSCKDGA